ncbi:hypothetical protein GWI33_006919 [Rhynchophorus ferrugineus]|uniref:Uncharacterized protein n=1 Tax=Rhynchophorus ferrugineus TaxID=354439 RepID=A0A834IWC1_RHYFE|nr:hypothetical protein GWI33_006919 [Rhynchophorus ferrugineus]
MPKTIDIKGHKLIAGLIGYFEKERDNGSPFVPVYFVTERVAAMLYVSVAILNKIDYKMKNNTLDSPKKPRLHTKCIQYSNRLNIGSI